MNKKNISLLLVILSPALAFTDTNTYDLGRIVVEGSAISKYRTDTVSASTYFDVPSEQLPVTVDVLTEDFIREQNPKDLHDLLFSQPGVSGGGKSMMDLTSGQYSIRGKSGSTPTLDGTLPTTRAMGMFLDPNALERLEIAKGPIGALQGGQTSTLGPYGAGGSINLVTKTPKIGDPFTDTAVHASAGSDSQKYRLTLDINASESNSLALRLPISTEMSKPFWLPSGHNWRRSVFLAPSLLWEATDDLRFGLNTTFQHTDTPGYQGIPSYQGKPLAPYNWDSYLAGDNDLRDTYTGYSIQGYIEWDASDIWQFRSGAGYTGSDMEFEHIGSSTYANQKGTPSVKAFDLNWSKRHDDVFNLYGRSIARYEKVGALHTTLFQVDFTKQKRHSRSVWTSIDSVKDYTSNYDKGDFTDTNLNRIGALAQNYAEIGIFRLLAGMRYDKHKSNLHNTGDSLSPRLGLSIVPTDTLTLFGNFSRTEAPNFGYMQSKTEELTSSWHADQYETGIRVSPVDTLWLTLAYYHIRQADTPSYEDASGYYVTEGESKNQGIEVSLSGNLTKNWSLYFGYAYNDTITKSGEKSFNSQPPHSISMQTMYRLSEGKLKDVAFGMGYRYKHGYDGTMRGEYVSPDYYFDDVHVFDCSVDVPMSKIGGSKDWTLQVAVKNIFGADYFESNRHYYQCFPGDPRTFEVALRGRF